MRDNKASCGWSKCPQGGYHRPTSITTLTEHRKFAKSEKSSGKAANSSSVKNVRGDVAEDKGYAAANREIFNDSVEDLSEFYDEIKPEYTPFLKEGESASRKFSLINFKFKNFAELSRDSWTGRQQEALEAITELQDGLSKDMSQEDIDEISAKATKIAHKLGVASEGTSPTFRLEDVVLPNEEQRVNNNYGTFAQRKSSGTYSPDDIKLAGGVSNTLGMYALSVAKVAEMAGRKQKESTFPERIRNTHLIGFEDARAEILESEFSKYDRIDYVKDIDGAIDQYNFEGVGKYNENLNDDNEFDCYFRTDREEILANLDENQQLYLSTAFVDRELRERLDKAGVKEGSVKVGAMLNCREVGLTYTVMQPDGNTRTFCVYEHRNSDDIIINGKQNYDPDTDELPYVADNSHIAFSQTRYKEYAETADRLAFFISSAQKGELPNDQWLAERVADDKLAKKFLSTLPGFKEFAEKMGIEMESKPEKAPKSDEDILNKLDFDISDDDYR